MAGAPPGDPPYPGGGTLPPFMTSRHNDGITRVLLLRAKENENPLSQQPTQSKDQSRLPCDPFLIARSIEAVIGYENRNLVSATKEARGTRYVLKTQSPLVYKKLLEMTQLMDACQTPVEVLDHPKLNFTQGIVFDLDTVGIAEDTLLNELRDQGVTHVRRITKKTSNSDVVQNTPLVVLTFRGTVRPKQIFFGLLRVDVRTYYQSVLLCRNCATYGHSRKFCNSAAVCLNCSQDNHVPSGQSCTNPAFCLHCNGPHSPVSRDCPVFRKEDAIIRLRTDRGISFDEARKEVEQCSQTSTYASKVQQRLADHSDKDREIQLLQDELNKLREQMREFASMKAELELLKKENNCAVSNKSPKNKEWNSQDSPNPVSKSDRRSESNNKVRISRIDSGPRQLNDNTQENLEYLSSRIPNSQRHAKVSQAKGSQLIRVDYRSKSLKRSIDPLQTNKTRSKKFNKYPGHSPDMLPNDTESD